MDSTSLAWWKRPDVAYTVDYGQLAAGAERQASAAICRILGIAHEVLTLDARALGSGDMAGTVADTHAPASDWWPYRNQFLITLVAMRAVAAGVNHLWIGTVASDGTHLDGTPSFVDAMSHLLSCQEGSLKVSAPAIEMSTTELIGASGIPRDVLAWAHSCHKADVPCGQCRGCNKYYQVLHELDSNVDLAIES
ncbi:7-cyano-7-deazaguanine synthase [Xanthomonas arboricola]|uniref:7-cyano-7-deazaguanine synthase n=1 Tax=Xanthomonas arboricola TaxID=56448 RepID=UPI001FD473BD|nr:7-cyano-7-deazaguanine synthase [Xanthomonas arboricola]